MTTTGTSTATRARLHEAVHALEHHHPHKRPLVGPLLVPSHRHHLENSLTPPTHLPPAPLEVAPRVALPLGLLQGSETPTPTAPSSLLAVPGLAPGSVQTPDHLLVAPAPRPACAIANQNQNADIETENATGIGPEKERPHRIAAGQTIATHVPIATVTAIMANARKVIEMVAVAGKVATDRLHPIPTLIPAGWPVGFSNDGGTIVHRNAPRPYPLHSCYHLLISPRYPRKAFTFNFMGFLLRIPSFFHGHFLSLGMNELLTLL